MRRRREESNHAGMERWLLTYADMITLLMAFFIMMYSMSVLNLGKFRQAAVSIRSGFGGLVKGQGQSILGSSGMFGSTPSPIEGDTAGVSWKVLKPLVEYVERSSRGGAGTPAAAISEDRRGIVITLSSDKLLFEPGSARIRPEARSVLSKIARTLEQTENLVQVEGHTCDLPPRGSRYPSNWELSTARATEVLRYLVENERLPASRFSAAGYGSIRPVAQGGKDRSANRRVEIVILRPEVADTVAAGDKTRRIGEPREALFQRRLD